MKKGDYDEDIEELMYELIEKLMRRYSLEEEDTLEILREFYDESFIWKAMSQ